MKIDSKVEIAAHMIADGISYEETIASLGRIYSLTPSQRVELRKGVSKLTQSQIDDIVSAWANNH